MATVTQRTEVHTVTGGGGLRLHVREWGDPAGPPILFIHGWSQNHLCWAPQYESALADEFRLIAFDLRGHGMSEAPLEPEHYTDGRLWADDLAAIIDHLALDRCVLVGWSYGAFVICDYVRAHGEDRIAAINFVEGVVKLGSGGLRHADRPGVPRQLRGRDRRRSADEHRRHAVVRAGVPGHAAAGGRHGDRACAGTWPSPRACARTSPRARSTTTTCCARSPCPCS